MKIIGCLVAVMASGFGPAAIAQSAGSRSRTAPVLTGIFPPGACQGETAEWTLRGRGLRGIRRLILDGDGVEVLQLEAQDDARLVAVVRVAPAAPTGFRSARVEGPGGVSNLAIVRVDSIPQTVEVEPNDEPATAQPLKVDSAVAGILRDADLDHYRVEARPGATVTVDFEARRLGTAITPVLTALNRRGAAIAQSRESRSHDHDAQLTVQVPKDGVFLVQVRDNTYGGGEAAAYRVRLSTTPYASAIFPLGGAGGKPLTVTASGGSLADPVARTILLPDLPGSLVDPGPFPSATGPFRVPMTLVVGGGIEVTENPSGGDPSSTPIRVGQTANGRIGRRGEVDRYPISARKGDKFRLQVRAESLGSWLDSVLTVRNKAGEAVAENDDDDSGSNVGGNLRAANALGLSEGSSDSRIDFEAAEDGTVVVEVTDRYGDGGPAFGYRLSVGPARPDVALNLLVGNPNASGEMASGAFNQSVRPAPGTFGAFNVAAGMKIPLNLVAVPEGRPGPVTVSVEGLPDGVTAEPIRLDFPGPGQAGSGNPSARADNLVLNVGPFAEPGLATIRFVATFEPTPGTRVRRLGSAVIGLNTGVSAVPARPITRRIDSFLLRVVGEPRARFVGPPEEPRLVGIRSSAPLLQGDRVDLRLDFDTSPLDDPGFRFEAVAKGTGLATNTVISTGQAGSDGDEATPGEILVRVLASPKAPPGVYPVTITYAMTASRVRDRVAHVIVRPPIEVVARADPIPIRPGSSRKCWVAIRREPGADVEVDLTLEGLPPGVKLAGPATLKPGEDQADLEILMDPGAGPIARPTPFRIVAIARMPRGAVPVESRIRPMLVVPPAE